MPKRRDISTLRNVNATLYAFVGHSILRLESCGSCIPYGLRLLMIVAPIDGLLSRRSRAFHSWRMHPMLQETLHVSETTLLPRL